MNSLLTSLQKGVCGPAPRLAWALVLVAILMTIQFRSIAWGLIVTSPVVLTILVNFAIMGFGHIPLDLATVTIGSIAIGIGIDYSIHISSRLRTKLRQQPDVLSAVDKTLETTGQAVLINALTVALGFIVLLGSNLVPLQSFGWVLAMTMLVSTGAAMTYLPAMILVFKGVLLNNNPHKNLKLFSTLLTNRKLVTILEQKTNLVESFKK